MIPVIPVRDIVSMPNVESSIVLGRTFSINAANIAINTDKKIILAIQKDVDMFEISANDIEKYGILATAEKIYKLQDGSYKFQIKGIKRVKVRNIEYDYTKESYLAEYDYLETIHDINEDDKKIYDKILNSITYLMQFAHIESRKENVEFMKISSLEELLDNLVYRLPLSVEAKQEQIKIAKMSLRVQAFMDEVKFQTERFSIETDLNTKVKENIDESQRQYYLREKMKVLKEELGDESDDDIFVKYEQKIFKSKMPQGFKDKLKKEIEKLKKTPNFSAEYNVIQNYLEVVLDLPFDNLKTSLFDIKKAKNILDEDHYGLKEVKDAIIEYLSVMLLKEKLKVKNDKKFSTVLCLVGPPGIGKTSFATSIAKAMNRKFEKISLGGVSDESEIRGHRRTYVGAMPGRIMEAMRRAKVSNPVILLDEIDKLDTNFKGDPASALLEVLDSSQRNKFEDHFIDYPYDLSNVFFICTANNYQGIPEPLYDRLEVIELESYTEIEKLNIAKNYLLKQVKEETAVKLNLTDEVILKIINSYTREAGVRNLKREFIKLARKIAREKFETSKKIFKITLNNLENYLGPEKYKPEKMAEKEPKVGRVNGLAWTAVGGTTLEVQAVKMEGEGALLLTGKLGDVMQESAKVAYSFVRSIKKQLKIKENFEKKVDIHLHFPEGAVPKDGPSAGITITTAIISVITNKKVRQDIAMTGEITITGDVLPVGGIKEKVIAAHRIGIREVILPFENEVDTKQLPNEILSDMKFKFVKHYDEILKIAFK